MVEEFRDLYAYNAWANDRIFGAVGGLSQGEVARDLGSSFPSIRETLAHLVSSEWIWLTRWRGTSPTGIPASWDLSTLEALEGRWRAVDGELRAYVDGLSQEDIRRTVVYRNTTGQEFAAPLQQLLRHVVNHSTYHRGQVVTMLRQLGAEGVATDLVQFHRERRTGPPHGEST
jgi:uncharacterized damage-inducible protein DinB